MTTLTSSDISLTSSHIFGAVRTPFGRYRGGLSTVRPDDLATVSVTELLQRSPALDPARIDDIVFGNANGAGERDLTGGLRWGVAALSIGVRQGLPVVIESDEAIENEEAA